ncbi:MAG TPA: nitrile hydratase subunit beta [Burkholderiales bacterium]|nr:nitrile hydratase subunit beta [Burkholderiales bacterium]
MNGVHDMGGMHGFGPIEREHDEPVFHYRWEARTFALRQACGALGKWNIDMARHANERIPPAEYLPATYYERWLAGLQRLLLESGVLTQSELASGKSAGPAPAGLAAFPPEKVEKAARAGRNYRVDAPIPAGFAVGARVIARNINPTGATRLPRYARGKRGTVDRDHGVFIFPDANAAGQGQKPQHLYSVRFSAREVWGVEAAPKDRVYLDLWEDYLEQA